MESGHNGFYGKRVANAKRNGIVTFSIVSCRLYFNGLLAVSFTGECITSRFVDFVFRIFTSNKQGLFQHA